MFCNWPQWVVRILRSTKRRIYICQGVHKLNFMLKPFYAFIVRGILRYKIKKRKCGLSFKIITQQQYGNCGGFSVAKIPKKYVYMHLNICTNDCMNSDNAIAHFIRERWELQLKGGFLFEYDIKHHVTLKKTQTPATTTTLIWTHSNSPQKCHIIRIDVTWLLRM
ncbi:hypothetical protein FF38_10963 [Lucilia cuprina]|uniref:Uncharacterized protein n=1 Tax=Lucilia cuprina TaxID=7375 RepID=A0A0L0CTZ0_LUCCU|nr:hypothetical protein FF38_10963 [Lucilia cuprina]